MTAECDLKDSDNLIKLREITRDLEFAGIVRPSGNQEIIELEMQEGTSYMVGLYKTPKIGVARNYASAGCKFPTHEHNEWELLVMIAGEMHLYVGEKKITLKEKEFYYLNPGTEHWAYFPAESWFLAITMPASEAWPEGG